MEKCIDQRYRAAFVENGILSNRLATLSTPLWISSVRDLQSTDSFCEFFSNKRKQNHLYDGIYHLQRDLIPEECRGKQGYLKIFLGYIHSELNLHDSFIFDAEKLSNIIRHRNRRYNIIQNEDELEISVIGNFLIMNKNMVAFSEFIRNKNDMEGYLISNLTNLLEFFNLRQIKLKRCHVPLESIKKSINDILHYVDSTTVYNSILQNEMEFKLNQIGEILNKCIMILNISKSNINSNGIYYKQLSTHKTFVIMISNVEIQQSSDLKKLLINYVCLNVVMKHLKINGPFKFFYQLVLLNANKPRLARKNKSKLMKSVELIREKISQFLINNDEMEME